jgi:hypothetical protein
MHLFYRPCAYDESLYVQVPPFGPVSVQLHSAPESLTMWINPPNQSRSHSCWRIDPAFALRVPLSQPVMGGVNTWEWPGAIVAPVGDQQYGVAWVTTSWISELLYAVTVGVETLFDMRAGGSKMDDEGALPLELLHAATNEVNRVTTNR